MRGRGRGAACPPRPLSPPAMRHAGERCVRPYSSPARSITPDDLAGNAPASGLLSDSTTGDGLYVRRVGNAARFGLASGGRDEPHVPPSSARVPRRSALRARHGSEGAGGVRPPTPAATVVWLARRRAEPQRHHSLSSPRPFGISDPGEDADASGEHATVRYGVVGCPRPRTASRHARRSQATSCSTYRDLVPKQASGLGPHTTKVQSHQDKERHALK